MVDELEVSVFRKKVEALSAEWNNHIDSVEGPVTVEFSTSTDLLLMKKKVLDEQYLKNGYWQMCVCNHCIEHSSGKRPLHVSIHPKT